MVQGVLFSRLLEAFIGSPTVFKYVRERSTAKNYHSVSLLSVVSKVTEKLVNNRIIGLNSSSHIFPSID